VGHGQLVANEYYCDPVEGQLRQGDIFECGPHAWIDSNSGTLPTKNQEVPISTICRGAPALLLNHDCEIAHGKSSQRVVICPVKPLSEIAKDLQGHAKKNRIANLFFLPRYKERLGDSVAVLNQLTTVHVDALRSIERLATLDILGRKALYAQTLRWLSRWVLAEVQCPHCEIMFDPSRTLPTRAPNDP
jgi:hypothetical protein